MIDDYDLWLWCVIMIYHFDLSFCVGLHENMCFRWTSCTLTSIGWTNCTFWSVEIHFAKLDANLYLHWAPWHAWIEGQFVYAQVFSKNAQANNHCVWRFVNMLRSFCAMQERVQTLVTSFACCVLAWFVSHLWRVVGFSLLCSLAEISFWHWSEHAKMHGLSDCVKHEWRTDEIRVHSQILFLPTLALHWLISLCSDLMWRVSG